jgi:long-chain acyl-CoA synthetase
MASALKPTLILIVGPTAVGKSEIAVSLARRLNAEIISADSRLFYRGMDIGTAKPSAADRLGVPHHLIDIANPDETLSLAIFQDLARRAIADIHRRGRLPMLVGGTGQYVRAVTEGWHPPVAKPDERLRAQLEAMSLKRGPQWLHDRLNSLDPEAAHKIDARNVRRTIRALEVLLVTGRKFSEQRAQSDPPYRLVGIGLTRPRAELYARIDARIEHMFDLGLVEEVKALLKHGYAPDLPAMSAIGYGEVVTMISGEGSMEQAKVGIRRATRAFVRRQSNWFKGADPDLKWFEAGDPDIVSRLETFVLSETTNQKIPGGNSPSGPGGPYWLRSAGGSVMRNDRPWVAHYDQGVPATLHYPEQPLFQFLEDSARKYPGRACTVCGDAVISFQDMNEITDRLAAGLAAMGVRKGDRVGIFMPNTPQFVMAYYGILKAGAVVVAMNPLYTPAELAYQANDAGIEVVCVMANLQPTAKAAQSGTKIRLLIVANLEDDLPSPDLDAATREVAASQAVPMERRLVAPDVWMQHLIAAHDPSARPTLHIEPDDTALFQYSGGTTGVSKAAVAAHRGVVANTIQFLSWLVTLEEGRETVLMAIPLFHAYGMIAGMSLGMALGATLALVPNARDMPALLATITKHHPTVFPGVPSLYSAINNHPDVRAGNVDLQSIRVCISGSTALLRETKEQFEKLSGGRICEGYGLSEAPVVTHCNPLLGLNKIGSIGMPMPDVDCKIVSPENADIEVTAGEPGELIIRGPQVMKGYHNMPSETAITLQELKDGMTWLFTGDIVRMDDDGYFFIVDRKKELIKPGGYQVWPREVEEAIASHPAVLEVGVAGIPDANRGEAVKAWIVRKPGSEITADEIKDWWGSGWHRTRCPPTLSSPQNCPRARSARSSGASWCGST